MVAFMLLAVLQFSGNLSILSDCKFECEGEARATLHTASARLRCWHLAPCLANKSFEDVGVFLARQQ